MKPNFKPIIITGNQKSGTSAIVSLLGEATGKSYIVDVFFRMGSVEERLLSKKINFRCFLEKARMYLCNDIIKEPEFILFTEEIKATFPDSRVVFIIRDPFENIRSILNRLNLTANEAQNIKAIDRPLVKDSPLWDLLYHKNVPYEGDNLFEKLVYRWLYSIEQIDKFDSDSLIVIKYETFTNNKIDFIEDLARKLNLPLHHNIEHLINYNFQPKGKKEDKSKFFTLEQINKIEDVCREKMDLYGY
jgi:hypothetical protein